MDWKDKLSSRKFWICVAAALASLGTGIGGIIQGNQTLAIIGSVCTVISAAIYAFCEAWVDGKAATSNTFESTIMSFVNAMNNKVEDSENGIKESDQ